MFVYLYNIIAKIITIKNYLYKNDGKFYESGENKKIPTL